MSVNSMPKENKMGTMPVKKLIFNMALPLIISMLIQALYNIVDSIFVSRISEDALTAVSLVFPVQNLMIAFATGTGVGMNALLSRRLGEKNREAAEEVANVGLLLSICTAVVFALFGVFGSQLYFSMQKGVSPIIAEYGAQYLSIVCIGSIGIFVEITAERMLQGTGQTLITMFIQGIGAIINIILDPIMIFGLLGCPAMGAEELEDGEFAPMFETCESKLSGKKIALFGSYGWGDGEWMRTWEENCRDKGANLVCDSVICQETPDDEALSACRSLGEALA